jgi:L-threonylcarbamoyladenylate synthase
MRTLHIHDDGTLEAASSALRAGEVVVVPTDTVYGVAVLPTLPNAVRDIYAAKQRPLTQHLPVMAATVDQVQDLGLELSESGQALARRWWPGPLTLVLGFSPTAPRPHWLGGRDEVAVRIPDHDFLRHLIAGTGPLLVTSANQHGTTTPPTAEDAGRELGGYPTLIVDGGTLSDTPSTLVNLHCESPAIEREGVIGRSDIERVLAATREAL